MQRRRAVTRYAAPFESLWAVTESGALLQKSLSNSFFRSRIRSDVHESLGCIEFSLTTRMDIIRLDGLSSELSDRADSADSTAVIRSILVHWHAAIAAPISPFCTINIIL